MSEDRKKLRELCDKATPGEWWIDSHGHRLMSMDRIQTIFIADNKAMGPAVRHPETGNLSHWPNDWDASYIVSVQPKVVRGLLDELDTANANHENAVAHMQRVCAERDQLKAENAELKAQAELQALLPELDEALEDLEIWGRHSDQGYRKLKDWYRKVSLACRDIDKVKAKEQQP